MQKLMTKINERRKRLETSSLGKMMGDQSVPTEERMSFVPSMLFFVMGFKDMLEGMEVPQSKDQIQIRVNQHCREDEGHWKWFLKDLEKINVQDNYLLADQYERFESIYSDRHKPVREMVYFTMHCAYMAENEPGIKLVIIEVLEAAFKGFLKNMHPLVKNAGMFAELEYFGATHEETEENHSIWMDDDHENLEKDITEKSLGKAHQIVDEMFDRFDNMFECWRQNTTTEVETY